MNIVYIVNTVFRKGRNAKKMAESLYVFVRNENIYIYLYYKDIIDIN